MGVCTRIVPAYKLKNNNGNILNDNLDNYNYTRINNVQTTWKTLSKPLYDYCTNTFILIRVMDNNLMWISTQ